MAVQYKTQCPHCSAQFKIGEQHLRQARGAVRCGSCLQVFQATDHLLNEAPAPGAAPAPPSAPAAKPAARPAARKPAADDESWAEALLDETPPPPAPAAPAATPNKWTLDDSSPASAPESLQDELDDTGGQEQNDTSVSLGGGMELSDSFLSLDEGDNERLHDEDFSSMSGAGRSTQSDNADESWAEALLQELENKEPAAPAKASTMQLESDTPPPPPRPARQKPEPGSGRPKKPKGNADLFEEDFDLFAEDNALAPTGEPFSDSFDDGFGDDFDDNFSELDVDTPARTPRHQDNPFARPRANLSHFLKWGSLSLAAVLVLTGQYLVFNFDNLARTPAWRPFYASLCNVAGCALPNPSDVSRLRGTNLIVRTHPQVPDALIVDAILFNHADYQQPFPVIELSFSSLRGQPLASRQFLPDEYLRGDLTGMTAMPRDVPIRVSFEIRNPGADAANYRLQLHPAPAGA